MNKERAIRVPLIVAALLLATSMVLPGAVTSAQTQPDKVISLDYGEEYEETMIGEEYDPYVYQVNVPSGTTLTLWVGTDDQGGCYWYGTIRDMDDNYLEGTSVVGPDANEWSDPAEWTVSGDSVLVEVGGDTGCINVTYPVYMHVRMEVGGSPPPDTPPPAYPTDEPEINFWADEETLTRGECTTVHWNVENVQAVYYEGDGVTGSGSREECPQQTTTYVLQVVGSGGEEYQYVVTVYVDQPSVPPPTSPSPTERPTSAPPTPVPPTETPWPTTSPPTDTPRSTPTPPDCPDYYEPNDFQRQAWLIEEAFINLGAYICTPDDVDWFSVVLEPDEELALSLHDLPGDYDLELYDSYATDLLGGSYRNGTQDETIFWQNEGTRNTFLIKIYSDHGDASNEIPYTLTIDRSTPPTPTWRPTPTVQTPTPTPSAVPWVLVVTHPQELDSQVSRPGAWTQIEGWLQTRYGRIDVLDLDVEGINPMDFGAIDAAIEARVATYGGTPDYILIVGGPAVVAFGEVGNPMYETQCCASTDPAQRAKCDCDVIYTDDLYGDLTHDAIPDVATARLPDGGDFDIYRNQFNATEGRTRSNWGSAMTVGQPYRPYANQMASLLGTSVQWSPPLDSSTVRASGANAYFILHGSDNDTSRWWGDNGPDDAPNPEAFNAALATGTQGTVASGACYGAYIGTSTNPIAWNRSIALTYVHDGAEAYVGATSSGYSINEWIVIGERYCIPFTDVCVSTESVVQDEWPVTEGHVFVAWSMFNYIRGGQSPLPAYQQAKIDLAASLGPDEYHEKREKKALHSYVFYGLPPSP